MTEDEMDWMASPTQWASVEQTPGDSEGQGSLACCSPWGCKGLVTTKRLNNKKGTITMMLRLNKIEKEKLL